MGCHAPFLRYSRCQLAGGATPSEAPAGWSLQKTMREPLRVTGFDQAYSIHWRAGLWRVQLPHMSGGSGLSRTMPSFRDLIQYWSGMGSLEAAACAAIATLRVG